MASLTGTKIKDTYDGLLKTTDNGVLGASAKLITDGLGNSSGVYLGTAGIVGIGTASPAVKLDIVGQARASTGILFGSDTAAANALDDYEEGEFTPVVADATTGGNVAAGGTFNGVYTKIGRQVTVAIQASNIDTTGMTSANELWFRNLPFTSGGFTGSPVFIGATRVSVITATADSLGFVSNMAENASSFRIIENIDSLNSASLLVSAINSGASDIWVTLTYFV